MADDSIESRVAVLEQIARNTDAGLGRTLTTLTIGLMLAGFGALGSLMAHGFKWWGG
jgi:hypothetical protein